MSRRRRQAPRRRQVYWNYSHGRAPWRRRFGLFFLLALLLGAPIAARAQGAGPDSVALIWTAPGDDGNVGTANLYDLRMSDAAITSANWDVATVVAGVPAPLLAGTSQRTMVRGLTTGTVYYFALRTRDEAGNWSGISNVVRWDWVFDTAPPGAPGGLGATHDAFVVHLQWSPNPEPDLQGYAVYRADAPGGTYTRITGSLLDTPQYTDDTVPAGSIEMSYVVTATDASGNESARSAPATVSFASASPGGSLSMEPVYPNPSRGGETVRIPITIPPTGAASAFVDILDAGARHVRRLDLSHLDPGPQTASWDGRNDAGRPVAPGVYTVLLVAGDDRQRVRLVRTP